MQNKEAEMTNQGKSPVLILIILILVSLSFAGGSFFLYQREHAKNLVISDDLDNTKTKLKMTETMLGETKKKVSALEFNLKETQAQIDNLTTDLEQEKSAKLQALSQRDRLTTELQQQKDLRSDLENKLNQAQIELKNDQAQLTGLQSNKMELETKVAELQIKARDLEAKMQGVELGKIVVSPEGQTLSKQKKVKPEAKKKAKKSPVSVLKESAVVPYVLEGLVLVVNKDYDFAVINLGAKDGIQAGNLFSVYNKGKYIGDLKIEKVHDSMAAADFVSEGIRGIISEGDKVIRKIE
jgi:multidrug efflux pump subunit AcrA (membrane-fusion protein)